MNRVVVCIVVVLVTSGCIALPVGQSPKQERPVEFVADNPSNTTYTFEVFVVETPANLTIRRSDGKVDTYALGPGVGTTDPGGNRTYTEVEVPDSARLHGRFTLESGESNHSKIEVLPRNFSLVIPVYRDENEIVSYVTASDCDELALATLRVTSHRKNLSVTHSCV